MYKYISVCIHVNVVTPAETADGTGICTYTCLYTCIYMYKCVYILIMSHLQRLQIALVYVHIHIYICVYIYISVCTYQLSHTCREDWRMYIRRIWVWCRSHGNLRRCVLQCVAEINAIDTLWQCVVLFYKGRYRSLKHSVLRCVAVCCSMLQELWASEAVCLYTKDISRYNRYVYTPYPHHMCIHTHFETPDSMHQILDIFVRIPRYTRYISRHTR